MFNNDELIGFLILSIVSVLGFSIVLFVPLWFRVKEMKRAAEEKRALREKNPISLDRGYFFAHDERIEIFIDDIDIEAGEVSGDVFLHAKADDTILSPPDYNDLSNVRLPVKRVDGTFERLSFDIANDKPDAFDGWELVIDSIFAKAG